MTSHPVITNLRIIGLAGRAGCGKDLAAAYLELRGYHRVALADPIKLIVANLGGPGELMKGNKPVRHLWQLAGTECGRAIDAELWIKVLLASLKLAYDVLGWDRFVVSDVRFPNEADALRAWGGKIIEIRRSTGRPGEQAGEHASETEPGKLQAEYVIRNDGTVPELCAELKAGLDGLGF